MKKNKERKRAKLGHRVLYLLFAITSLMLLAIVLYVNILPLKYLLIFIGGLFLLNLVIRYFLCKRKKGKKLRKIFSIITFILSILFLAMVFLIFRTFGVLSDMTEDFKEYKYYVMVYNESSYKNISDIENKLVGYYNDNSDVTKEALSVLNGKVAVKSETYGNLDSLGSALLSKNNDAILLEDSQKTKLDNAGKSDSSIKGFADNTRVIYEFTVKLKNKTKGIDVTKNTFNIYISGMDEYGDVVDASRSDVNIVVTVNPKTKQVLLTNIPRDYYVKIHDTTGLSDKLTHAGIYGIDTSISTIEDLLGIKIDYYVKVNFSSLVNVVDALGGVEVYSEYDFQSWNGYNFSKGYNKVNGQEALSFVRERKSFNDGDNQRGKNQQAMIEAMLRKCMSPSIITRYNSLLNSLNDSMITNLTTKNITKLAKMQLKDNSKWIITSYSLKGNGASYYTYTYPYQALYVTVPDEQSIKEAKDNIAKVASDETLEASYAEESSNVHSVTKSIVSKITSTFSNINNSRDNTSKDDTSSSTKKEEKNTETKKEEPKKEEENTTSTENTNSSESSSSDNSSTDNTDAGTSDSTNTNADDNTNSNNENNNSSSENTPSPEEANE